MSKRGVYIILSSLASLLVAWKWGVLLKSSEASFDGIIAVFSILAGVLVAVISIVGDPSMLIPGNWRVGHEHAKDIQNKIARFSHLFSIYIITIFLVLFVQVAKINGLDRDYFYQILAFFVLFGFLLSLPLPYSLMAIQKERMSEEIRRRKSPKKQ